MSWTRSNKPVGARGSSATRLARGGAVVKVHFHPPKSGLVVVLSREGTEGGSDEHVFWQVSPVVVGTCKKLGNMRYRADDGRTFSTLRDVSNYMADRVTNDARLRGGFEQTKVRGMDLVARGVWHKFCELRELDVRDHDAMEMDYYLAPNERAVLILEEKHPGKKWNSAPFQQPKRSQRKYIVIAHR